VRAVVRIPQPPDAGAAAAFSLWHRLSGAVTQASINVYPFLADPLAVSSTAWTQDVICLNAAWQGQLTPITLWPARVSGTSGAIELDEAAPILSAQCP
jgi:hypothetical protein